MGTLDLVLGIDSSTQSTTAVVMDRSSFATVAEAKVRYRDDPRLASFGLTEGAPILPPRESGEAEQPVALFLAALEALLSDLGPAILGRVAAIDLSAQQHGQVWLGADGAKAMAALRERGSGAKGSPNLVATLGPGLAYNRAPIWMSANTEAEAEELRASLGGSEGITARSGSDSPLRFSGAVLRRESSMHSSSIQISPLVIGMSPVMQFKAVDFPHPEGPMMATISPDRASKDTSFTAVTSPAPDENDFFKFEMVSITHSSRLQRDEHERCWRRPPMTPPRPPEGRSEGPRAASRNQSTFGRW